ncbi:hypothetical protein N7470_000614 [Penicillium chermesinum]|nr:hypothetical protein N7470_000614 [Penicillium chermesinum]
MGVSDSAGSGTSLVAIVSPTTSNKAMPVDETMTRFSNPPTTFANLPAPTDQTPASSENDTASTMAIASQEPETATSSSVVDWAPPESSKRENIPSQTVDMTLLSILPSSSDMASVVSPVTVKTSSDDQSYLAGLDAATASNLVELSQAPTVPTAPASIAGITEPSPAVGLPQGVQSFMASSSHNGTATQESDGVKLTGSARSGSAVASGTAEYYALSSLEPPKTMIHTSHLGQSLCSGEPGEEPDFLMPQVFDFRPAISRP